MKASATRFSLISTAKTSLKFPRGLYHIMQINSDLSKQSGIFEQNISPCATVYQRALPLSPQHPAGRQSTGHLRMVHPPLLQHLLPTQHPACTLPEAHDNLGLTVHHALCSSKGQLSGLSPRTAYTNGRPYMVPPVTVILRVMVEMFLHGFCV